MAISKRMRYEVMRRDGFKCRPGTWRNTLLMFWANGLSGSDMTIAMYNLMDDPSGDRNQVWNQFCRLCWQELPMRFSDTGLLSLADSQEVSPSA